MNIFRFLLCGVRLLFPWAVVLLSPAFSQEQKAASPARETKGHGLWIIPPDFRKTRPPDPGDPFSQGAQSVPDPDLYPRVIPAMGPRPPRDVRKKLEGLGVVFQEGDIALMSESTGMSLLFVRTAPAGIELVDRLAESGVFCARQVEVTFVLRRTSPEGNVTELIRRSLQCVSGTRTSFRRFRGEKPVEELEFEAFLDHDNVTLDLNIAAGIHLEDAAITFLGQAFIRRGEQEAMVLYTGPDTTPAGRRELTVTGKVLPLSVPGKALQPSPARDANRPRNKTLEPLAEEIERALTGLEKKDPGEGRRAEIYTVNPETALFNTWEKAAGPVEKEIKSPVAGTIELRKVTAELIARKIPLSGDDEAWYEPEKAWLYLRAGALSHALTTLQLAPQVELTERPQIEARVTSWADALQGTPREDFSSSALLFLSGSGATMTYQGKAGKPESLKLDGKSNFPGEASLTMELTGLAMGGEETWNLLTEAATVADGISSVSLASGMALDAGGRMKHLTVSSRIPRGKWRELLLDPEKKNQLLSELETALKKP